MQFNMRTCSSIKTYREVKPTEGRRRTSRSIYGIIMLIMILSVPIVVMSEGSVFGTIMKGSIGSISGGKDENQQHGGADDSDVMEASAGDADAADTAMASCFVQLLGSR